VCRDLWRIQRRATWAGVTVAVSMPRGDGCGLEVRREVASSFVPDGPRPARFKSNAVRTPSRGPRFQAPARGAWRSNISTCLAASSCVACIVIQQPVIQSTSDKSTHALWLGRRPRDFPPSILKAALRKLTQIEAAVTLEELRFPPGNRLEALKGDRAGQHSIRANDRFRVCFRWEDQNAHNVEITGDHSRSKPLCGPCKQPKRSVVTFLRCRWPRRGRDGTARSRLRHPRQPKERAWKFATPNGGCGPIPGQPWGLFGVPSHRSDGHSTTRCFVSLAPSARR